MSFGWYETFMLYHFKIGLTKWNWFKIFGSVIRLNWYIDKTYSRTMIQKTVCLSKSSLLAFKICWVHILWSIELLYLQFKSTCFCNAVYQNEDAQKVESLSLVAQCWNRPLIIDADKCSSLSRIGPILIIIPAFVVNNIWFPFKLIANWNSLEN